MSNLIDIYAVCTGKTAAEVEQEFAGRGYGDFKPAVGEAVVELLRPIREETERLLKDKGELEGLYRQGAEKARAIAGRTLSKVHKKVGFIAR
ncbi:Tryptophan--tRNA ligase [bioreactor metagenome]|uniref:Tryptophan--tRNA ligase n=1 Tax=bioreactor metagenome TaxID=1076179 RepID=A0A645FD64_9ZZZZ